MSFPVFQVSFSIQGKTVEATRWEGEERPVISRTGRTDNENRGGDTKILLQPGNFPNSKTGSYNSLTNFWLSKRSIPQGGPLYTRELRIANNHANPSPLTNICATWRQLFHFGENSWELYHIETPRFDLEELNGSFEIIKWSLDMHD